MTLKKSTTNTKVIDLFCGVGGMTHGFMLEGLNVVAGIDFDSTCKFPYETNNNAKFIEDDIRNIKSNFINELYGEADTKILIGCAPCQPFSTLNSKRATYVDDSKDWGPLDKYAELINDIKPDIVSMENVKELIKETKYPVFKRFITTLKINGYEFDYKVVDTAYYGIPQRRKRLVLLASRLGPIKLLSPTHEEKNFVTVRDVISALPPIKDGETDTNDRMHTASKLTPINKSRILATPKDGGSAKSWSEDLLPECYKKASGKTYLCSVYGRMKWDQPAPTMTTHCVSLGTGRFGHPEQNRAISLREAARFQTFPDYYQFAPQDSFAKTAIAKQIGNAVPVKLGQVIARSIIIHLQKYKPQDNFLVRTSSMQSFVAVK
jgi:DNA (cytosine-5)-methyltransferase 1